jgi:hypothetical protein
MILGAMDQKLWVFEIFRRSSGSQKTFYFKTFLGWIFFHRSTTTFQRTFGEDVVHLSTFL